MYQCKICSKQFEKNTSVAAHTATHTRNLPKPWDELGTDRSRKNFLLRVRGHRCEVCMNSEWMGKPIPIELDHINGVHDDCGQENLRLICPNCHAQTETYKAKNKGRNSNTTRQLRLLKYPIAQYRGMGS